MQQSQAHLQDLRVDHERQLVYRGSALVRLEHLRWNKYLERNQANGIPDRDHVQRIKRIFEREGCRQLQLEHHVPCIVDQRQLHEVLNDAQRRGRWQGGELPRNREIDGSLDKYPELAFASGIECLRGRHRIQAGTEWLAPTDKWWIVDLYQSGISYELETLLIEEYANAERPCDGEIYRKIRKYQYLPASGDSKIPPLTCISLEMRWWARFNRNREKRLKSLFRSKLAAGFDGLMKIPGLLDTGMKVTTLHTMMATKCDEEILSYLQHTRTVWEGFVAGIDRGFQRIDKPTVKALELRAPGSSTFDAQYLRGRILGGAAFGAFDARERTSICQNVLGFRGIIPSLFSFFQDIYLLKACADSLGHLLEHDSKGSLYSIFGNCYVRRADNQTRMMSEPVIHPSTYEEEKRLAYLHLITFAMREYHSLPRKPSKGNRKEMSRPRADPEALQRLAGLADQLGFQSANIRRLNGPSEITPPSNCQELNPLLVTTGPGLRVQDRCGLPRVESIQRDRKHLYLSHLSEERDDVDEGITSFFVLKSWFAAFFDPPQWRRCEGVNQRPDPLPLQAAQEQSCEVDFEVNQPGADETCEPQQPTPGDDLRTADDSTHIQEAVQALRQQMSIYAKEANRRLEVQQATDQASGSIQSNTLGTEGTIVIRFVEREGNGHDMVNPLSEYGGAVLEVEVDRGDPHALIDVQVQEFLRQGKRTCDRYKKQVFGEECYNVAVRKENSNTLFLIPDVNIRKTIREAEEPVNREIEDLLLPDPLIEEEQDVETLQASARAPESLEDSLMHVQMGRDDEDDSDLLDREIDHATNAQILGERTITIYLKRRLGDSLDVSRPANECEWTDAPPIQVPVGDPEDQIIRSMQSIWQRMHLKPYDSDLNILAFEDCYKAAQRDANHTLYLMAPSIETREEIAVERTMALVPPPPRTLILSGERVDPEVSADFPRTMPERPLPSYSIYQGETHQARIAAITEVHRDKIGRGPNHVGKDGLIQNRVGLSSGEEPTRRRKKPDSPRVQLDDNAKSSEQTRRLRKLRRLKSNH